jgi:hypothetical protein
MNRTGARQKVKALLPSLTPIFAHCPRGAHALNIFATFSMVARCPNTFSLGVCTSSAAPAVRSRVPHVEKGVGAIATQAHSSERAQLPRMGSITHTIMYKGWRTRNENHTQHKNARKERLEAL